MARIADSDKLDAQPLLDWIEQRGGYWGFAELLALQSGSTIQKTEKYINLALRRGRERGWLSAYFVDEMACLMGIHPYSIYGNEWFYPTYALRAAVEAELEAEEEVAA